MNLTPEREQEIRRGTDNATALHGVAPWFGDALRDLLAALDEHRQRILRLEDQKAAIIEAASDTEAKLDEHRQAGDRLAEAVYGFETERKSDQAVEEWRKLRGQA